MASLLRGRMTHHHEGELVVFHIGMTINRWYRPDKWMPILGEMGPMLRELSTDPESGLKGFTVLLGARGPYLVQYWSSLEKLYSYASAPGQAHRPAWSRFNKRARTAEGAVGIWHETYVVERAESIYVDTPAMGLPRATSIIPVGARHDGARARVADGATPRTAGAE